ncbi:uncharacterized protein LOC129971117 [Argiope bruennichi]|uniref:uncharacterized protein LOC129971117 n=1 Tax=Argiope bruennichi TaxID=94029 RepID=UPI002493EE2E|nr:uncharacterized protein LOC129971117 [Argiope bruennichi]
MSDSSITFPTGWTEGRRHAFSRRQSPRFLIILVSRLLQVVRSGRRTDKGTWQTMAALRPSPPGTLPPGTGSSEGTRTTGRNESLSAGTGAFASWPASGSPARNNQDGTSCLIFKLSKEVIEESSENG